MFESNELLINFKHQVETLIEQLTKLTYSDQCEGIEFIRNCLENLKISKRKNTGLCYSVRRKSESGKTNSKSRTKKENARKNKKDITEDILFASDNPQTANITYSLSEQETDENNFISGTNEDHCLVSILEQDLCENVIINDNLQNGIDTGFNENGKINAEASNDVEQFEVNYDLNKGRNVSNESIRNKRKSTDAHVVPVKNIQTHKKTKCSNIKRKFVCIICDDSLPNMADLIKHILSHECAPSSCLKCKAIFQNRITFNYHVSSDDCTVSLDVKGLYVPPEFNKQKEDEAKHVLLSCPYCGIRFGKIHTLKRHLKERCVCVTRKYQCNLCDQSFVSEDIYEIHKKKHQKFQCTKCELSFWNRRLLREHRKTHGMVCKKANMYVCQQCKNTFRGRMLYREHREICKQSDSFPDPVWCKECVMMFRDRYTYKRHCIRKNHVITDQDTSVKKPFVCEKCGTAFASSYGLSTHCSRMHQQKAVFSCDQCSYTTMRVTNLSRHKNCRHGGEIKKYVCDKCPALLSTSTSLRYHYETFHSEAKNFHCDICSKSFKLKTQLNRHKLIHSTVMPHNCQHCPKGFLRASLLQRHIHSKHDEHIPKDQLAISVMKFNKNNRKKPSTCASKTMEQPLDVAAEVPEMQPPKDQVFSLIDVQSGELVTLSVTEMSNSAVINMSDGDLLNGIHIPDLWTNPAGLFSLDPMMQDAEASAYSMLADGGPHVSQDLLKTLHGQLAKETMGDYMPQYLEIDGSHKDMSDGCLLTQDYGIKPNMLTQTILTSDNMIITMPNPQ